MSEFESCFQGVLVQKKYWLVIKLNSFVNCTNKSVVNSTIFKYAFICTVLMKYIMVFGIILFCSFKIFCSFTIYSLSWLLVSSVKSCFVCQISITVSLEDKISLTFLLVSVKILVYQH